ncbi:hypothetical protein LN426_14575 [Pseudomonas syringae]|uniref:hypothetical protein n=5 Tax=Pseudomonas syringae TaxID=317 RepID=UPI0018E5FD6C|nr:hypothetical protein [Pseudomonas syringae]MBI6571898.1 hypothetical protein [Pseudomonas syringae]MBI6591895.1 hypothetical protein [Pseudomonas syringae]MDC6494943.1 hypothetical protein [Pseudomonas syringae]MDC6526288.1 hypothetical protein [Pseudomonas syringae]MDC6537234.1 hypothetical protein [Pseudomonas syringae]
MKDVKDLIDSITNKGIRELLTNFFSNSEHGKPDSITRLGCLNLAAYGPIVWNTWRTLFPAMPYGHFHYKNISDFSCTDFNDHKKIEFSGYIFGDGADFSYCKWERYADFFKAEWGDHCKFVGTDWGVRSTFDLAVFGDNCDFTGCCWGHDCAFEKATIGSNAKFSNTYWSDRTYFNETHFGSSVNFDFSIWSGTVSFSGVGASGLSNINMMYPKDERTPVILEAKSSNTFSKISFRGAKFLAEAFFDDRIFNDATNFSSYTSTSQCKLVKRNPDGSFFSSDGKLVFVTPRDQDLKTVFHRPPSFHSARLHVNTSFDGVVFPEVEGSMYNARAYRTLKILFGQIESDSDVKAFKRLEMAEELAYKRKANDEPSDPILLEIIETTKHTHNIKTLIRKHKFSQEAVIVKALGQIDEHLISERWADAASNARKVLESCLLEISHRIFTKVTSSSKHASKPRRPVDVRDFLLKAKLFIKTEHSLLKEIYGFLSEVGAHPHDTKSSQAGLAVTSGLSFAEFALLKFDGVPTSNLRN